MAELTALVCPKCRGQMRSYERNGIVIDQCEECRERRRGRASSLFAYLLGGD